jgi:lipopolysaccharide/colanic/teichoic acid biosynthesis glycosyltransferase
VKRALDCVVAIAALAVVAPLLVVAALGIRLTSRGPALYRSTRIGLSGQPFTILKLRTMSTRHHGLGSRITELNDPRIFPLGRLLRRAHIDELPQLVNVVLGTMSLVGPRPEDPAIVDEFYTPLMWETLAVRPGITSPGTLYAYTHGEAALGSHPDPEIDYARNLLGIKIAIDLVYLRNRSVRTDLLVLGRTARALFALALGRRLPEPPELEGARALLDAVAQPRPVEAIGSRRGTATPAPSEADAPQEQ